MTRAFETKAMMEDMEDEDNLSTAMAIGLIRSSMSSEMNQQLDEDYSKQGITGMCFEASPSALLVVDEEEAVGHDQEAGGGHVETGSSPGEEDGLGVSGNVYDARELYELRVPGAELTASEMSTISHADAIKNSNSVMSDDPSVSIALIDKKVKRLTGMFKSAGQSIIDSKIVAAKEANESDPDESSIANALVLDEEMYMAVQKKEVCVCAPVSICLSVCLSLCPVGLYYWQLPLIRLILTTFPIVPFLSSIQPKQSTFARIKEVISGPSVADAAVNSRSDGRPSIMVSMETDANGNAMPAEEKQTHGHLMRAVVLFLEKHSSIKRYVNAHEVT